MLATSRALISNPTLLLLEEPSEAPTPLFVQELTQALMQIKASELSMVFVEQNLNIVRRFADYVHIMSRGSIGYESTPEKLRYDKEAQSQDPGL